MKQIHYISGLPRTGSTVLCNLLMQNPQFHATATSGLPEIIIPLKNGWDDLTAHKNFDIQSSRIKQRNVLEGVMQAYYEDVEQPVIFDKSREWPSLIESLNWIHGEPIKMIVTVRNVRQILESLEAMYRRRLIAGIPTQSKSVDMSTMEKRAQYWVGGNALLGSSYDLVRDAVNRGNLPVMHFVRFEDLTMNPEDTMKGIYEFLGYDYFNHDFNHVEQVIFEDDRLHGFDGLHDIHSEIKPPRQRRALGTFGQQFEGQEFWDNFK